MLNHLVLAEASAANTMLGNIIVVTGSFLILLLLLKKFAWSSISAILKKREDKIANDLDSAEQSRISAQKLEQEREMQLANSRSDAAEILRSAKESGELNRQNILKETQEEVSRLKEKARTEIADQKQQAMTSVKDDVSELSLQIAEKILKQELNADAQNALINQYIEGLDNETR